MTTGVVVVACTKQNWKSAPVSILMLRLPKLPLLPLLSGLFTISSLVLEMRRSSADPWKLEIDP